MSLRIASISRVAFASSILLAAACSAAPDGTGEGTTMADGIVVGNVNGSVNGSATTTCGPGMVLECGGGRKNGVCILPECVSLGGGGVDEPTCGFTGGACCGSGTSASCTASYAACVAGTCQLCGEVGEPPCGAGQCQQGIIANGTCTTCDSIGASTVPSILATPTTMTVTYHFSQPVTSMMKVTLVDKAASWPVETKTILNPGTSPVVTFAGLTKKHPYAVSTAFVNEVGAQGTIAACHPADVAVSTSDCGAANEMACSGNTCDNAWLFVDTTGHCVPCGNNGEPVCAGNACTNSGLVADGTGHCTYCGGATQHACTGNVCNTGFAANGAGRCVECGHLGEIACKGNCADQHAAPNAAGVCAIACGQLNQECCSDEHHCQAGLICDPHALSSGKCIVDSGSSGSGGIYSCPNGTAKQSFSTCTTCNGSGYLLPFTTEACSMDDAIAATHKLYTGNDCFVYPGACNL